MNAEDRDIPTVDTHVVGASPSSLPPVSNVRTTDLPRAAHRSSPGQNSLEQIEALGTGTEGEVNVWTGRYSFKNFIVRPILRVLVTVCWVGLLSYLGDRDHYPGNLTWEWFVTITGGAVAIYWLTLFWQVFLARAGHLYRLTNRRIFIDTGVFRRRRDQIELLRVQDVFVKQPRLLDRLMDVGTVVIESSEERLPVHYLVGVDEPNKLMDQVWHQARKERDLRSVKVDEV